MTNLRQLDAAEWWTDHSFNIPFSDDAESVDIKRIEFSLTTLEREHH
jgi:hypothetical protein